jgi:hypothetical protein
MGPAMRTVTFWEGVVIALLASVVGNIGFFALTFFCSDDFALRMLISGLAFVYLFYLFSRSRERTGRIIAMPSWLMLIGALWFFYPPLSLFLIIHVLAVWLIRCLYFYRSLLACLADLGLAALSVASAFWALHHTGSLFLAFWCFFLLQALFIYIPTGAKHPNPEIASKSETDFKRAYQAAEAAVRKLSTIN